MNQSTITVTVKLFAAYQEAFGVPEMQLQFPAGTPVAAVCDRLIAEQPQLAQWRDLTRFGINLQFVAPDTLLQPGDEVVLIPPVSGGGSWDRSQESGVNVSESTGVAGIRSIEKSQESMFLSPRA